MYKLKKTQFFLFDLILALIIIVAVIGIALSLQNYESDEDDIYKQNLEIIEDITQTKIKNLNNDYIIELFERKKIENLDFSIAQQIASFYDGGELDYSKNLTKSYVEPFLKDKINCQILINDTVIYNITKGKDLNDAKDIFILRRTILGFYENKKLFGPYDFEIITWE